MYRVLQRTIGPLVRLLWRLRVEGAERLPDGAFVLAANHDSLLDPFFLGAGIERPLRFLAKQELWRGPLPWVLDAAGGIPVARGQSDERAIAAALEALAAGDAVAIFPEGTALPYRERRWRRGAARLAGEAGVPLVPVCIVNSERALRPHKVRIGFPQVRVLVGQPFVVARAGDAEREVDEATARLRAAVEELRRPYGAPAHAWID